jgi:hypothetical protein
MLYRTGLFLGRCFFSSQGVGYIVALTGTMSSVKYVEVLQQHLLPKVTGWYPTGDWVFVQDNAPCHMSLSTRAFLSQNQIRCMHWPHLSPDLNAIENSWVKMCCQPATISFLQLENQLKPIWSTDPTIKSTCRKLVHSDPCLIQREKSFANVVVQLFIRNFYHPCSNLLLESC